MLSPPPGFRPRVGLDRENPFAGLATDPGHPGQEAGEWACPKKKSADGREGAEWACPSATSADFAGRRQQVEQWRPAERQGVRQGAWARHAGGPGGGQEKSRPLVLADESGAAHPRWKSPFEAALAVMAQVRVPARAPLQPKPTRARTVARRQLARSPVPAPAQRQLAPARVLLQPRPVRARTVARRQLARSPVPARRQLAPARVRAPALVQAPAPARVQARVGESDRRDEHADGRDPLGHPRCSKSGC